MSQQYNLNYIVKNIIESRNVTEYIKKIRQNYENIVYDNGIYKISKDDLLSILENSKKPKVKEYIEKINSGNDKDILFVSKPIEEDINTLNLGKKEFYFNKNTVSFIKTPKGEIFFKAREIALILGYVNTKQAIIHNVDKEDKISMEELMKVHPKVHFPVLGSTKDTPDGENEKMNTLYINESGLYSLILSSHKPQAKEFKHWVTKDVLPQIRKF